MEIHVATICSQCESLLRLVIKCERQVARYRKKLLISSLAEEEWKRYRQQLDTAEQHLAVALVASSSHRDRHARESRE